MRYQRVKCGSVLALLLLLTAGPARSADPDATIRLLAAQDAAVAEIGDRLSVAARPLCPAGGWVAGLVVQTRSQYGTDYRDAATRVLRLGEYPTISFVVPDGAAARAGLAAGDQILAVDSRGMPRASSRGDARMTEADQALDALDVGLSDGEADMRIVRDGVQKVIRLRGTPACHARFEVRPGGDGNASATRDRVQVSSDLIDLSRPAQTLAPLVAHELSHVILRHEDALKGKWGGLLPGFGKNGAAIRATELAADRLSVYLLALAGYDPADAIAFGTEFGRANNYGIFSDRTHPDWRARVVAIRVEVARVQAQQTAGAPIRPPADLMAMPSR